MLINILKAFLIGICASAPIGPIAILVIQKSLSKGHKAGFITGMGACLVDTLFSIIAIFFLAIAQKFLKTDYSRNVGMLCGSMANPMALNYASTTVDNDEPAVSYATAYPMAMFARVIIAQLVILLLA